ncbi:YtxH domain-containing protein [Peribacillus saganii]|uniref:YtxH domain-containing protein n=1 Tax=Peribacillus saganii TaxID=2303992 RepID=UPI0018F20C6D|nr:YtxH domain-containing protein [Peribacillus saganii]
MAKNMKSDNSTNNYDGNRMSENNRVNNYAGTRMNETGNGNTYEANRMTATSNVNNYETNRTTSNSNADSYASNGMSTYPGNTSNFMHDGVNVKHTMTAESDKNSKLLRGLIIGGLIGVGLALLDTNTRRKVKETAVGLKDNSIDVINEAKENPMTMMARFKEASNTLKEAISNAQHLYEVVNEDIFGKVNEVKTISSDAMATAKEATTELKEIGSKVVEATSKLTETTGSSSATTSSPSNTSGDAAGEGLNTMATATNTNSATEGVTATGTNKTAGSNTSKL